LGYPANFPALSSSTLSSARTGDERDFETTFATFVRSGAGGLVIGADSFSIAGANSSPQRAPPCRAGDLKPGQSRIIETGGLMSYGGSLTASYRWAGIYTGRILKGEKRCESASQGLAEHSGAAAMPIWKKLGGVAYRA
jgi:hypothetical protein